MSGSARVYLWTRADGETGVGSSTSRGFDLSQLKVLRSLEVVCWAPDFERTCNIIVMKVFSTITSPVFSEFVILTWGDTAVRLPSAVKFFKTLHAMNNVRPFILSFLLMSPDWCLREQRRELAEALDLVAARGLFDFFDSPPTIHCGRSHNRWWDAAFR